MTFDYLADFPIPVGHLPPPLISLMTPTGFDPDERVEVTTRYEYDYGGANYEFLQMLMAVVKKPDTNPTPLFREASDGLVQFSEPHVTEQGGIAGFKPSVSGHDYIVASSGNGSFYSFHLSEKVWMALGLTARCVGNDIQKLHYDDLSLPEINVAEGDINSEYFWNLKRNVQWKMSNEYLRRYLWMRGCYGVRIFFYEKRIADSPVLRRIMKGETHYYEEAQNGWYNLDIREHEGALLLQIWATVDAIEPKLCPEQTADGLVWPGISNPVTHNSANKILGPEKFIYIDDKFLQKYEMNQIYKTHPFKSGSMYYCGIDYHGQWSFTGCTRRGRNMIHTSIRELYKAKPDREIIHAHRWRPPETYRRGEFCDSIEPSA